MNPEHITPLDVQPELCKPLPNGGTCIACVWLHGDGREPRHSDDIYSCNGWILCGDCRYELRYGHKPPPPRLRGVRPAKSHQRRVTEEDYDQGSETLNRFRHVECGTELEYRILQDIDRSRGD